MARLGDLIEQIRGVSYKPEDIYDKLEDNSITLLRANNIKDGQLNFDDVVFVDKKRVHENQLLKAGDILICTSSGSKELVGKAAYVQEDLPMTFGAFCKVIRPKKILSSYLGQFFNSPNYRQKISDSSAGANINNIRNEHIDELDILLPAIERQEYVATVLEKLSNLIFLRKQQLAKLDELVKAQFAEMFGDPVQNDKKWPIVSIGDIAEIRIGPFGTMLHKEDYMEGGHALINPSHIVDGKIEIDPKLTISDEKYGELASYALQIGDVVLGRRGEMGRCAVVYENGLLCGTGSMIIRPNKKMKPYFLQNILSNPTYKRIIEDKAVGVTMMNLNVPIVSELRVPQLPVALQDMYIKFMTQVERQKLTIQQSLDKLEVLKKSLMQEYFK